MFNNIKNLAVILPLLSALMFPQLASGDGGFIYYKGVMTDLGTLGGSYVTSPSAINNLGQVVGYSWIPGDNSNGHAFLWTEQDGMIGILNPNVGSVATSINDNGVVSGYYWQKGTTDYRGFIWNKTDGMIDIGVQPNALNNYNFVNDINIQGQVVGDSYGGGGYIWTQADGYKAMPGDNWPENTTGSSAINDKGIVTGSTTIFGDRHAYLWSEPSGMVNLGTINGFSVSLPTDINNNRWVIGYCHNYTGSENRPFLWTEQHGMIDFGPLIGTTSYPLGINDLGHVVGRVDGISDSRAFLWTMTNGVIDLGITGGATDINNKGQIIGTYLGELKPRFPTSKDQCKNGGWSDFGFENQGQCIKYVNALNNHDHEDNHDHGDKHDHEDNHDHGDK